MGLVPRSCRIQRDCLPMDDRTNATYLESGEMIASTTSPYDVRGETSSAVGPRVGRGVATLQPRVRTPASRTPIAIAPAVRANRGRVIGNAAGATSGTSAPPPLTGMVTAATKRYPRFATVSINFGWSTP